MLGSLKYFLQLDHLVDISQYLLEATTLLYSKKVVGIETTFNPISPLASRTLKGKSQVLSYEYDMDAYMATLLGSEAWDLC